MIFFFCCHSHNVVDERMEQMCGEKMLSEFERLELKLLFVGIFLSQFYYFKFNFECECTQAMCKFAMKTIENVSLFNFQWDFRINCESNRPFLFILGVNNIKKDSFFFSSIFRAAKIHLIATTSECEKSTNELGLCALANAIEWDGRYCNGSIRGTRSATTKSR